MTLLHQALMSLLSAGHRETIQKDYRRTSSGRKLRPQKGGGQSRMGSGRPGNLRGGTKSFGRKRATGTSGRLGLPSFMMKGAWQELLASRPTLTPQRHGLPPTGTKAAAAWLDAIFPGEGRVIVLSDGLNGERMRGLRNLVRVKVLRRNDSLLFEACRSEAILEI